MTTLSTSYHSNQSTKYLLFGATAGIVFFMVCVILLHVLLPEFDFKTRYISEYVHSAFGFLLTASFIALGIGSLLLARALFLLSQVRNLILKIGLGFLFLWGVSILLDAFFPLDKGVEPVTFSGNVHLFAAMTAFLSLMIATLLLSLHFRQEPDLRRMAKPALLLCGLIIVTFVISNLVSLTLQGLMQRIFVFSCLGWLLYISSALQAYKPKGVN